MKAVWVTRPSPGNAKTASKLRQAGYPVISAAVLEVVFQARGRVPSSRWPDWVVFVSGNAVVGLEEAVANQGLPPGSREGVRVAAVGTRTSEKARDLGWNVSVVPDCENAEGLLDALGRNDMEGQTVWIPSGSRAGSAREVLPRALESRGAKVESFQVYVTQNRRLTGEEISDLDRAEPGALILHSPSGAEAVFDDQAPTAVRRWHEAAVVSVGPATTDRSRELGAREMVECKTPSDAGILAALGELNDLRTEGTLP